MTPLGHRQPGLAGAVLEHDDVTAEIVCDGVHVHPAMVRVALAAKRHLADHGDHRRHRRRGPCRAGSRRTIGGRPITVGDVALLDDGTIAGSVLTMDRAFAKLVSAMGVEPGRRGDDLRDDAGARARTCRGSASSPRARPPTSSSSTAT